MKLISAAFLTLLAGCAATTSDTGPTVSGDPYLWLEEVESDAALAQVREWNGETAAALTEDASFETYRERAYEILANPDRLAGRILGPGGAALSALVAAAAAHSSLIYPKPRNAIDSQLPGWSGGKAPYKWTPYDDWPCAH